MAVGACQARGVPAMLARQPGHCALIWAKPNIAGGWDWKPYYDISGIDKSSTHNRIQTPWLNADFMTSWEKVGYDGNWWPYQPLWTVFAYNHCLKNIDRYIKSTLDNNTYDEVLFSDSGLATIFATKDVIIGDGGNFVPKMTEPSPIWRNIRPVENYFKFLDEFRHNYELCFLFFGNPPIGRDVTNS